MNISPHALTTNPANIAQYYSTSLFQMLLMFEESGELKTQAYTDDKGIPTIGIGINMRAHMDKILDRALGITDNALLIKLNGIVNKTWGANLKDAAAQPLRDELNKAIADYKLAHPAVSASNFVLTDTQVKAVFDLLVPDFNLKVTNFLIQYGVTNLTDSREFLALMSLAWANPGKLLGPGLGKALQDGNRAEAWFQIRYGSNLGWDTKSPASGTGGVAARRDVEAHLFGLYNGATASEAEARSTYTMLTKNRATILAYEAKLGVSPDSPAATGAYLTTGQGKFDALKANINTALVNASLPGLGDALPSDSVPTLLQSLTPAYTPFITYANTLHGAGAPDIDKALISNAASIYFQGDQFTQTLDARVDDARTGNSLSNNLIVGGAGLDTEYGGKGADYLMGLGGVDNLDGGEGDDTLIGGTGDDKLQGGAGTDVYAFTAADGKDTVIDSDGLGSLVVGGTTLTGATNSNYAPVGSLSQWTVNGGEIVYTLDEKLKKLVITGTSLGTDSQITINGFDINKPGGYLGLKLERSVKLAVTETTATNFWTDPAATLASLVGKVSNIAEGTAKAFTIALNMGAKAGDTITLALSGAGDKFEAILGDSRVPANGAVITLTEGQTEVRISLVETGALSADATANLSATYKSADPANTETTSSNVWSITATDSGDTSKTFIGDQRGKRIGVETLLNFTPSDPSYNHYDWSATTWTADGTLTGGIAEADYNDVITGTTTADKISGKGGNDALSGGEGNDQIDGGDGDDLIGGGLGSDSIKGGAGNDYIYSAIDLSVALRTKADEQWDLPVGATLKSKGSNWGIATTADQQSTVNTYLQAGAADNAPDFIDAGDGDDTVVAGRGNDMVQGGLGDDVLWGGGGNDVVDGGDGRDIIHGEGLLRFFNTPGYVAPEEYGDDFLDGGAGDDQVEGQGGNDSVYGGGGNDALFGDDVNQTLLAGEYHGKDYMDGEDGNDYMEGGGKDDVLYGGAGNDDLQGDALYGDLAGQYHGNDILYGEEGNDLLRGDGKDDTLYGGVGDDTLYGDIGGGDSPLVGPSDGNDFLDGGQGKDELFGGGKDDILLGGADNDLLRGDTNTANLAGQFHGSDTMDGGTGNDKLLGDGGADTLFGGEGDDVLRGDANKTEVAGQWHGNDTLDGGNGNDLLLGDGGADTLVGGEGDDELEGDATEDLLEGAFHGNDTLDGGNGNDRLFGLGGVDVLFGGSGNDVMRGDAGEAEVSGQFHGGDTLDGGDGDDLMFGDGGADTLYGGDGNDILVGDSENKDIASQWFGNDTLYGGAGDDYLYGGGGDDTLDGGSGGNTLKGGEGNDTYVLSAANATTSIDPDTGVLVFATVVDDSEGQNTITVDGESADARVRLGIDGLGVGVHWAGNASGVYIQDYEAAKSTTIRFSDGTTSSLLKLVGDKWDQVVDSYSTSTGATVFGGMMDDTLTANGDRSVVNGGKGNDTITLGGFGQTVQYTLGDGVDTVGGNGTAAIVDLQGGIKAEDLHLEVNGQGQMSVRLGDGPEDRINLGIAQDAIKNSVLIDHFVLDDGSTLKFADLVARGVSQQGTTGGSSGDAVRGTDLDDVMDSVAGNVLLQGGAGADTYVIHDGSNNTVDDRLGHSLVRLADVSDWAQVVASRPDPLTGDVLLTLGNDTTVVLKAGLLNVDKFTVALSGGQTRSIPELVAGLNLGAIKGDDDNNDAIQGSDGGGLLDGKAGDDQLTGGTGSDWLLGGAGNDVLDGGAGNDVLFGGQGDDTFVVQADAGHDQIFDYEGTNTLRFGAGIAPAQLVVERMEDSTDIRITIDANNSIIVRRALEGSIGLATFADGTQWTYGDLINTFGSPNGKVIAGDDLANTLDGTSGNDIVLGNRGDDILRGHGGDDDLKGGDGKDRLFGGAGSDVLDGNFDPDTFHFALGDGVDRLVDTVDGSVLSFGPGIDLQSLSATRTTVEGVNYVRLAYSATDAVLIKEGVVLDGAAFVFADGSTLTQGQVYASALEDSVTTPPYTADNDVIYGYAGNDTLQGGAGNDHLLGGKGNDTLDGGADDDTLEGGAGDDTYVMTANGGHDAVIEAQGQNSTIDMAEGKGIGDNLSSVSMARSGTGLLLTNTALNSSFYIANFFNSTGNWTLTGLSGGPQDLRALAIAAQQGKTLEQRREDFYSNLVTKVGFVDLGNGLEPLPFGTKSYTDALGNEFVYNMTRSRTLLESDAADINVNTAGSTLVTDSSLLRTISHTVTTTVTHENYTTTSVTVPGRRVIVPTLPFGDPFGGDATGFQIDPSPVEYTVVVEPEYTIVTTTAHPTQETFTETTTEDIYRTTITGTSVVGDVRGGNSANTITLNAGSSNLVSGGGGDDVILGKDGLSDNYQNPKRPGNWVDGGAGNDTIKLGGGDDEINGGQGSDYLSGGAGEDVYLVMDGDDGWDTIDDSDAGFGGPATLAVQLVSRSSADYKVNPALINALGDMLFDVSYTNGGISGKLLATPQNLNALLAIDQACKPSENHEDGWASVHLFSHGLDEYIATALGQPFVDYDEFWSDAEAPLRHRPSVGFTPQNMVSSSIVNDTVRLGAGIEQGNLSLSWGTVEQSNGTKDALLLSWGGAGGLKVVMPDVGAPFGQGIELFEFADGTQLTMEQMLALAPPRGTGAPSAISIGQAIAPQQVLQDQALNFQVPADAFSATGNKTTRYSATLVSAEGDGTLPGWMSFDGTTGTFSGVPPNGESGDLKLEVKAWLSDTLSATQTFTLSVLNVNDAPQAVGVLDPVQAMSGQSVSWALPIDAFADVDTGDRLSYRVEQADGTPLPSWITVNYAAGLLEGIPARSDVGVLNLRIVATDLTGATASQPLTLNILAAPKNPIAGTAGNDTVLGTADADALQGLGGSDQLYGGAGDDDYLFTTGFGQTVIVDNDATAGNSDTIRFGQGITPDSVVLNRMGNSLVLSLGSETITVQDWFVSSAHQVERVVFDDETVWTSSQLRSMSDTAPVLATPIANLSALVDAPVLFQLPVNTFTDVDSGDTLSYTATLDDGNLLPTWLRFNAATQTFTGTPTLANAGTFSVQVTATDSDGVSVSATFAVGVSTAADQTLSGTTDADILTAGSGNDTLDGGMGVDNLIGKSGNDTYRVDNVGDSTVENANEGTDTTQSSISWNLGANLENLTLTGTDAIDATGNDLDNMLVGNAGDNILMGASGNDTLMGGAGNDTMAGGPGDDAMSGGLGDDLYIVDSTQDVVTEASNAGTDTVLSSVSRTLGANVENLTLTGMDATNATGNSLANLLVGNSANNTLNGGAGADAMRGGLGNDTYVVDNAGDVVTENANEGTDTVKSSTSYTLGGNVENLTLTGSTAINGTGNDANNILTGNAAANTLNGGLGNDTLNGAAGADTLFGAQGDDTYVVDNVGDVVTEQSGEGTDLVQTALSYSLSANIENLTLTGSAAVNATGNELGNTLIGNSAANTLTGGDGNDTLNGGKGADILLGGTGDDIYVVDNALDSVTESAGEGTDTVQSSISYTLSVEVENLTLTGTTALNASGNALHNVLTGNTGSNILDGGLGADDLIGGAGNDTYIVDNLADVVAELAAQGIDLVKTSVDYTLGANLENLTLTGTDNLNASGNALDNKLTGNAGNNVLNGMGGSDTLVGGVGDDTYIIDNATTVVTETTGNGVDSVNSSASYTLSANVENLVLTGTATINGTGNTLANTLTGNTADNVLNGGAGADAMSGGLGNDTYVVDNAGDTVTETTGEGVDLVQSSINWTLGDNLENLTITGTAARTGTGNTLDNLLTGNSGANSLTGMEGNDTLDGGAGADKLIGGTGNDTYKLGRGYGADTITENDATVDNNDIALFGADIAMDQLWFLKVGNNLEVDIIGTSDKFTLTNWYLGDQYHVEQFKTSDGKVLLDSQVQALVDAMAAFSPPAAGQTTLTAAQQATLNPVLAANWH